MRDILRLITYHISGIAFAHNKNAGIKKYSCIFIYYDVLYKPCKKNYEQAEGIKLQTYEQMTNVQLEKIYQEELNKYNAFKSRGLCLDMTRGKPCSTQLDLAMQMLENAEYKSEAGTDCRNYGILDGLPEMKRIFAELLEVSEDEIIVGGNSSLNLMHDCMVNALLMGVDGESEPWIKQGKLKFLCPVPGYDRHFAITEKFGFEMINVPMNADGPDMDMIENLVSSDPSVKGVWCVPKYSNPGGVTYSDESVRRFAALKPAAKDFRIFWDNAYLVHDFADEPDVLLNIFDACRDCGSEDMVYEFASTSKISFAGAGVACIAASKKNCEYLKKQLSIQTIGNDKLNQLRHSLYFKNADGVRAHMKKHAEIVAPKFALVLDILDRELRETGIAAWTNPKGGYFISYDQKGCASRIISLAKTAGLKLTPAGSTYPYRKDESDTNLRIAPTLPSLDELNEATQLFCVCARLAAIEKILSN